MQDPKTNPDNPIGEIVADDYRTAKVLEDDLHKHVRQENNIAFPKAAQF